MRIAHIAVELVPSSRGAFVGGLVKSVATLAEGQANQGHEVELFTSDINHKVEDGATVAKSTVHRINTIGPYGSLPFALSFIWNSARKVTAAHRRRPFDIIHVHSAYVAMGIEGYFLGRVNAPKIFSLYSPNFGLLSGHSCKKAYGLQERLLTRGSLSRFDRATVPSENIGTSLQRFGIEDDFVVRIPPSVDPVMFRPLVSQETARRDLGLKPNSFIVLFVGNFSGWKGVDILIQSISRLKKDIPEIILLAAWGEPYEWTGNRSKRIFEIIKELQLEQSVHQVGIVNDIRTLLSASDILVAPFKCTCKVLDLPLSIIEAMACGKPVISTSIGGIPELLGNNQRGILVEPGNVDQLTDAIRGLVHDRNLRDRIAASGRDWILNNLKTDDVRDEVQSLYYSLINEKTTMSKNES